MRYLFVIFFYFQHAWSFCNVKLFSRQLAVSREHREPLLMGYVPPEEDAEYRDVVKKSLQRPTKEQREESYNEIDSEASLPVPKEGDIVLCPGKWKGEQILARVRYLQYMTSSESWVADVSPLEEGKSADIYIVEKGAKALTVKVSELQPVRSFFVRSEDGYRVNTKKNSTEYLLRAPKYKNLTADFALPIKSLNMTTLDDDLERYEGLKTRFSCVVVTSALQLGVVGTVVSTYFFGLDISIPFLFGSGAGAIYLYLLGKLTDSIGAGYSRAPTTSVQGRVEKAIVNARFLVPAICLGLFAAKNYVVDGDIPQLFKIVSREQFLGVAAGFLSNRVAIYATEIRAEVRAEDLLSIVPGSFAETYRQAKKLEASGPSSLDAAQQLSTILVVTGPRAAGRSILTNSLLMGGKLAEKLQPCKYLTTDTATWQKAPTRYKLMTEEEMSSLRNAGKLVYEGEDKGLFGSAVPIAICLDDLLEPIVAPENKNKRPLARLVEGPPEIIDALSKISKLRLLNIWISLQTKEQFIDKASAQVQSELLSMKKLGRTASAQQSAEQVSELVNEAARDVTYYMSKAPIFEYTLLNAGPEDETLEELELLLKSAL